MEIKCKKCGSTKVFTDTKGSQTGIYCSECGKWIKWATKDEIRLIEHNSTSDAKLTVDAIAELQAENKRLLHENIVLRTKYDNTVDAFTKYGCKIAILTKRMEKIKQIVNKSYTEDEFYFVVKDIKEVLEQE